MTLAKVRFIKGEQNYPQILDIIDKSVLEKDYGGENAFQYVHEQWKQKHFKQQQSDDIVN